VCSFAVLEPTPKVYRVPRVSPGVTAPKLFSPTSVAGDAGPSSSSQTMAGTWEEGVHLYVCGMCDVCVVYVCPGRRRCRVAGVGGSRSPQAPSLWPFKLEGVLSPLSLRLRVCLWSSSLEGAALAEAQRLRVWLETGVCFQHANTE